MSLGDVEGPANLAPAGARGRTPVGGFGGAISNGIAAPPLDAEPTLDWVILRIASTSTTEGPCMTLQSELAVLRALVKLFEDVTYRLQASIDAMEQDAEYQAVAGDQQVAHEVPF